MGQVLGVFSAFFSSRQAGRACTQKRNMTACAPRPPATHENRSASSPSKHIIFPTLASIKSNPEGLPSELLVPSTRTITECNGTGVASELIVSPTPADSSERSRIIDPANVVVSSTPATSENSWAWLPGELGGSIAERLPNSDYFRFGAVCTSWASALAVGGYLPPRCHYPWLMLSHDPYSFLSFPDNWSYHFPSEMWGTVCLSSQDGQLVSLHGFSQSCLRNPITRSKTNMPPFSPNIHIRKVILSSSIPSATAGNSFLIVVMYGLLYYHLAFTRAGNTSWATLSAPYGIDKRIQDVVYHDGMFLHFCPRTSTSFRPNWLFSRVIIFSKQLH